MHNVDPGYKGCATEDLPLSAEQQEQLWRLWRTGFSESSSAAGTTHTTQPADVSTMPLPTDTDMISLPREMLDALRDCLRAVDGTRIPTSELRWTLGVEQAAAVFDLIRTAREIASVQNSATGESMAQATGTIKQLLQLAAVALESKAGEDARTRCTTQASLAYDEATEAVREALDRLATRRAK